MYNSIYGYDEIDGHHGSTLTIPVTSPDSSKELSDFIEITFTIEKQINGCIVVPKIPVQGNSISIPSTMIDKLLGSYFITIFFSNNTTTLIDKSILKIRG